MNGKNYYITTPIYYPSGRLTVGNAYTTVAADAEARFRRMQGYDVMFLTGTDEHGLKIAKRAADAGMAPKAYVDGIVEDIRSLWKLMDISYDKFIRTTDEYHEEVVSKIYQKLYDKGDIYKYEYEGLYCVECEAFWTETQAVEGKCPDCGRPVQLAKEESYFFRLSNYVDRLLKYYEDNPTFLQPQSRVNEMINNFIKPGLKDLCISRTTFDWGVKLPFDDKHVAYVWIDALSNYISALGYLQEDDTNFKKYWPADVHLVGKDIVRFHAIIWPILLMALDLPLPKQVFGHGWLMINGDKLSKSKAAGANIIDPVILCGRYGVDAIRYYLLREVPFGADGNFSNEALINRINSDLANDLGNLVSRTTAMSDRYFGGNLPLGGQSGEPDGNLKAIADEVFEKYPGLMENLLFPNALAEVWRLVSRANKYIDETSPWVLAKDEATKPRLLSVLKNLCEAIRVCAILIKPAMPTTSEKILSLLNISGELCELDSAAFRTAESIAFETRTGAPLFPRIDLEKEIAELIALMQPSAPEPESKPDPTNLPAPDPDIPQISIDDFAKVELRVALVTECDFVKKSDKLLLLKLDLGYEQRQVVSGIRKWYSPDALIGRKVILVANLKPAMLRGIESQGMVLAADSGDDVQVIFADDNAIPGSRIR